MPITFQHCSIVIILGVQLLVPQALVTVESAQTLEQQLAVAMTMLMPGGVLERGLLVQAQAEVLEPQGLPGQDNFVSLLPVVVLIP